jgi:hypothetical protein
VVMPGIDLDIIPLISKAFLQKAGEPREAVPQTTQFLFDRTPQVGHQMKAVRDVSGLVILMATSFNDFVARGLTLSV